jgi:hypothetical protein
MRTIDIRPSRHPIRHENIEYRNCGLERLSG